jgi:FMN reductase (NADPH)
VNPTLDLMSRHRSIRRFGPRPVPREVIGDAVTAAEMASSSSHTQSYCVLRITDPEVRERLVAMCGNQRMVADAGAFLVVCGDFRRHLLLSRRAGEPHVQNLDTFLVAVIDAALFGQNLALALEAQGLGICYVGSLRNRLVEVDALLDLPDGVLPIFGLCVGDPAEKPARKPRLPLEAVLFEDRYPSDERMLDQLDAYDDRMREYYAERGIEGRRWSDGVVKSRQMGHRAYLHDYYVAKRACSGAGETDATV